MDTKEYFQDRCFINIVLRSKMSPQIISELPYLRKSKILTAAELTDSCAVRQPY